MAVQHSQLTKEGFAKQELELKLALKKENEDYYRSRMAELGLRSINRFLKYYPNPSKNMRVGITFAHRGFEIIASAIANKKEFAVISGLNPSGPLHFGHKIIFDEVLYLQKLGGEVFIPLTNDESYLVDKVDSVGRARKIAYQYVIPSIIALGFDPDRTHIFVHSDYEDLYNFAIQISNKVTINKVMNVFGFKGSDNPGTLFFRIAQIASILMPQLKEFGGPKPTVVPVGIDQHPYILLARDIAERMGLIPPAGIYLKFIPSLDGQGKMSASRERSAIFLTEKPRKAEGILQLAYTGGSALAQVHKEFGGVPEICPIYYLQACNFANGDSLYNKCRSGEISCEKDKQNTIRNVKQYLSDHQKQLAQARKLMPRFLLKTKIKSILDEKSTVHDLGSGKGNESTITSGL
ncbi:tryptophan--tRNA ligase [candidate division NPL-UPA2 bacterium]|nr:tryptophan--tRNA ligase [candidate division NPL-UPA2 bacterium]